ncbi:DNA-binding Lrp family transcriptional regulator [Jatrophihabitans sp. GAS493]|nr:Lrp/AsnC family transcriptional regulator [Jatrophihabitans sp. GAS493]SOD72813.1 DNA-binding Lrp family transcriptional regulator [Jatrophihabitans sp. GAS493]
MSSRLDALDVTLLQLLTDNPRIGILELSRLSGVARATVSARLDRIQQAGIVTGYGPDIDVAAAGYPVQAMVTLEIAQGRLADIRQFLTALPGVLEAYATTGSGDVLCRLAAESNEALQELLLKLNESDAIRRSTSVVILSVVVAPRTLPLLLQQQRPRPPRAPAFRERSATAALSRSCGDN